MAKVSIITPLYNGSKTLLETIESVLNQDFEDWEWIFFDDGSNDGTQEIAKKFVNEFPGKIFYYEHEGNKNFGTANTRNRAIEKSNGELIAFIDQDDIWYRHRLSYQINIFDKMSDCAMIWSPALYWYKERSFKQPVRYEGKDLKKGLYQPPEMVDIFLSDLKGTPLPSASLVRRKFFNEANGFEESIRGSEDIVLWVKLANRFPIYYDDEILIKYRKHSESTLRQAMESGKMYEWDLVFYKWVIDFLKNTNIPVKKELIKESEFAYYVTIKKISSKFNYINSRKEIIKRLNSYPYLKKKYFVDFLLDVVLPFDLATKVSAKIRFDWFKKYFN